MNHTQIKYFLTAARCLNFTEAAKQLFITQSALSQQITVIEAELNMQLFIRYKNKLRLTPAASVLLDELPVHERQYNKILDKARVANSGSEGTIKIGVLQGQMLTPNFRRIYDRFRKEYPNVCIQFSVDSFGGLRKKLDKFELDIALTTEFDIKDSVRYLYEKVDVNEGVVLVSMIHPLAQKKIMQFKELKKETIIVVDRADSEALTQMIALDCQQAGFVPNLKLASTMEEQMLWIDAGLGVGIITRNSYICMNPNIKVLDGLKLESNFFVTAWHRDNINFAIALFTNYLAKSLREHNLLIDK